MTRLSPVVQSSSDRPIDGRVQSYTKYLFAGSYRYTVAWVTFELCAGDSASGALTVRCRPPRRAKARPRAAWSADAQLAAVRLAAHLAA